MATTWNPSDKSSLITLSGGNLTATHDATASFSALRATQALPSLGLIYWETTIVAGSSNNGVGIGNASATLSGYIGSDNNGISYFGSGGVFRNGGSVGSLATYTAADVIGVAVNLTSSKVWFRKNGGGWNNDILANQDPAAGTGGISISAMAAGPYFPAASGNANDALTVNFGVTTFAQSIPSGFLLLEQRGALSKTLDAVTLTATGRGFSGSLAQTLSPITLAGIGSVPNRGSLARTLAAVTLSAGGGLWAPVAITPEVWSPV